MPFSEDADIAVTATDGFFVMQRILGGSFMIHAFDATEGKLLWEFNCGAGAKAMPVSYTVAGRQYEAMGCGGNTQVDFKRGNTMMVFALPTK